MQCSSAVLAGDMAAVSKGSAVLGLGLGLGQLPVDLIQLDYSGQLDD